MGILSLATLLGPLSVSPNNGINIATSRMEENASPIVSRMMESIA
jgi:hypothetical protein